MVVIYCHELPVFSKVVNYPAPYTNSISQTVFFTEKNLGILFPAEGTNPAVL